MMLGLLFGPHGDGCELVVNFYFVHAEKELLHVSMGGHDVGEPSSSEITWHGTLV